MSAPLLLALVVVAASPLHVRVLEKARLTTADIVGGGPAVCDGNPLAATTAHLEVDGSSVRLAEARCQKLRIPGPVVGIGARRFRGEVVVSVIDGRLAFINAVDVEDYLRAVVADELNFDRPQAVAAQAVVSRTFALASRGRHQGYGYDLCDLTHCQLYRGIEAERPVATQAVSSTQGRVLMLQGALVPAFFHAACGGATSDPAEVFGEPRHQAGVVDTDGDGAVLCAGAPEFRWTREVDRGGLAAALGVPAQGEPVRVLGRDKGGRVLRLSAFGVPMTGERFHSLVGHAFGFRTLRSLKFTASGDGVSLSFHGSGQGHGVGFCQYGALELDRRGRDWRAILKHYFPDSEVR